MGSLVTRLEVGLLWLGRKLPGSIWRMLFRDAYWNFLNWKRFGPNWFLVQGSSIPIDPFFVGII